MSASRLLDGLNYGDSEWTHQAISDVKHQHKLSKIEKGSYYVFGSYEQDNDESNGKEDIEWLVLAKEDDRILVTSRFALDCKPYNEEKVDVTWETCSLRKWLNDTFLNEAFDEKEQEMILSVTVNTEANSNYKTDGGNITDDKIFLLSIEETRSFFDTSSERKCVPTPYAIGKGVAVGNDLYKSDSALNTAACRWWLRSPGYDSFYAAGVQLDGDCYDYGYNVNIDDDFNLPGFLVSVRPTLWLRL